MRPLPRRLEHGEEATLVEHLGELRSRLVVCLLAVGITTGVAFGYHHTIVQWLNDPLPTKRQHEIITYGVSEPFLTSFLISFWAGIAMALPVCLWQFWSFFAPAFTRHVQRKVVGFAVSATGLMFGGIAFGYFIVLPAALHFLTNYDSGLYNIQLRARDYYSFVLLVLAAVAVCFELPVFVLALTRIGILPVEKLRRNRRWGYVIVAAVAVALPGIDPVTTTLEMIPLMILFEGSIWLSVLFDRRWKLRAAEREAAWQREYGDSLEFDDGIEADAI